MLPTFTLNSSFVFTYYEFDKNWNVFICHSPEVHVIEKVLFALDPVDFSLVSVATWALLLVS